MFLEDRIMDRIQVCGFNFRLKEGYQEDLYVQLDGKAKEPYTWWVYPNARIVHNLSAANLQMSLSESSDGPETWYIFYEGQVVRE